MKISLAWLADFVDLKEKDSQKISAKLTESTAEIDAVEDHAAQFDNIVVGEILEIHPHPEADRIQITKTRADKVRTIICGAKNIAVGQKVPVALPGAKIGDIVIEERKMRGVLSEGMICSESELGLAEESEGIMVLPATLEVGESFALAMGLADQVLEVSNTAITNRPDLFAHYGFAREFVANALGAWQKDKQDFVSSLEEKARKSVARDFGFDYSLSNPALCPRWCAVEMENVHIQPSPAYIQNRLRNCGIRPLNNVVDATNYVMLELGMPMHAFDRDKIQGKKLSMREAKKGEIITSLDGKAHKLPDYSIVFEDAGGLFDLCGLMGGASSAINPQTKNLLVHAPVYDPVRIRRTALALNHRTDAATIYEKGVPPSVALAGLWRTVELILATSPGAKVASRVKDVRNFDEKKREIGLKKDLIDRILGQKIAEKEIEKILSSLGFELKKNGGGWSVAIPAHRLGDIAIPEDLAEEVVRIYGLNRIGETAPEAALAPVKRNPQKVLIDKIGDRLVGHGFYEVLNLAFLGPALLARLGQTPNEQSIEVQNPLSVDQSLMRPDLFPRLLETAEKNVRFREQFAIFECGHVFTLEQKCKKETPMLAALLVGQDFFAAKGVLEAVFRDLNLEITLQEAKNAHSLGANGKEAEILIGNQKVGLIFELAVARAKEFSLNAPVAAFSLAIDSLADLKAPRRLFRALPRFPGICYDIAVLTPKNFKAGDLLALLQNADDLITKAEIMEVFAGKDVPEDQKSITVSLEFRSSERTLTEVEVKAVEKKLVAILEKSSLKKRFS